MVIVSCGDAPHHNPSGRSASFLTVVWVTSLLNGKGSFELSLCDFPQQCRYSPFKDYLIACVYFVSTVLCHTFHRRYI